MKKYRFATLTACIALSAAMAGQGTEAFLRQVAVGNPVLKHYESILEARRVEASTGNNPGEFTAAFGYFPGTPDDIGLKRTFEASQAFDFPTTYILRGKLNRETFALAETEFGAGRVATLLEARLLAYEYIALRKKMAILEEKQLGYDSLRMAWELLLDEGAVTILDYNRLLLEVAGARSETASGEAALRALVAKLEYISGGGAALLGEADYDIFAMSSLDNLIRSKRESHPGFLKPEKEYLLAVREVDISRAANLPGFEIGFGSEIIAGEHYTGPKVGVSVPVWTNRNRVKLSQARVTAAERGRDAAIDLLVAEAGALYENCLSAERNFTAMSAEMENAGDTGLLIRALSEKEITTTEFFSFMEAVYEARLTTVQLELEYMTSKARLNDHALVSF
ncbi:MAG: TolC family protein [Bacteroidales bacterium]|nr:TolC family protein [Bacteroidales bacterium]